ncbi:MAG TPA: hypothetical protein PLP19_16385 [bacterium]|nr:hypothetical protein [bacterium]HPN45071.1 hypothetical protein [bacterium]
MPTVYFLQDSMSCLNVRTGEHPQSERASRYGPEDESRKAGPLDDRSFFMRPA